MRENQIKLVEVPYISELYAILIVKVYFVVSSTYFCSSFVTLI